MTGTIPRDWSELDLGTLAVILDTLRIPLSSVQRAGRSGRYPYCGANGVLDYIDDFRIDDDVILLAEDGGNFDQFAERPIAYRMRGKIWVNNHAHVLKAANGETSFLFYALEHKDIRPYISSGTRSKLTRSELVRIKVAVPNPRDEQRCIASSIEAVDKHIVSLERLITKKQAIKQGMMQELLTGRTRLPGFTGEWQHTELGSHFEITSSKRVFQHQWRSSGVPFYRAREITVLGEEGRVDNDLFIDRALYLQYAREFGAPKAGDFLVTAVGTLGKTYVVRQGDEFYFKDASVIWFRSSATFDSQFLRYLFETPQVQDQVHGESTGTTVGTYTIRNAKKTRVFAPPLPEQKAIAEVLNSIDREVQCYKRRLDKACDIKQGMMQELLTGRTRLPVREAVA